MDKDLMITVLESIDLNDCNMSEEQKEAFLEGIKALKRGSKSWKGYRRFKKKYVYLLTAINQFGHEMIAADERGTNLTWKHAMNIFWSYFQEDNDGNTEGKET